MNKKDRIILRHDNNHTGQKGTEHMDIKSLVSRMTLEDIQASGESVAITLWIPNGCAGIRIM